jgi:hypothetical protein
MLPVSKFSSNNHWCLFTYRNSVFGVPEILESVFATLFCGWSRNSGPSVLAVVPKFYDGRSRNSGIGVCGLRSYSVAGPEILDQG